MNKNFFLLTLQKINPLILLFYNNFINFLIFFIILSIILRSISRLNYSSLKKIITYSSINQLRWLINSIFFLKFLKIYFLFYFFIIWSILKTFKLKKLFFLNQILKLNFNKNFFKIFIIINILSLGGLPPFLGFYPKLILIIKINNLLILFIILFSLLILFIYIRLIITIIILNSIKLNKFYFNNNINKIKTLINFNLINHILLILYFFIN